MYKLGADKSLADHCDDLYFLCAALLAFKERYGLSPELEAKLAEAKAMVAEGDALASARLLSRRAKIETDAKIRIEDDVQEGALAELYADCMAEARQNRAAPVVQACFEEGLSRMIKPELETQTATLREVIGKLGAHDVYAGTLRERHVPALTAEADAGEALLKQRAADKRELEAAAARELDWKERGDLLRDAIGGLLIAAAADRGVSSPRQHARSFFERS